MGRKLEAYKKLEYTMPETYYKWPLYGEGFSNLGKNSLPVECEMPEIKPNELLLRIDAISLCFSDVKVINLGNKHSRIYERDMASNPVVLGHEASATVVRVGEERKEKFKVGERYVIQPDVYYKGEPTTFGYSIEGALQQYVVAGNEILDGDEGCYLLESKDTDGYTETALLEPWSCVEAAYSIKYRNTVKHEGIAWFVGAENAKFDLYNLGSSMGAANHPKTVLLSNIDGKILEALKSMSLQLGFDLVEAGDISSPAELNERYANGAGFDDIVVLGTPFPDFIEASSQVLANGGVYAIISDTPVSGKVLIDVGRIHYDGVYYTGTKSTEIFEAYDQNRVRDIKPDGKIWLIGAGGPLGQMHTQRAASMPDGPSVIIATDIDALRISEVKTRFEGFAEARNASFSTYNTGEIENPDFEKILAEKSCNKKFDDIIILAPVARLIEQGASWLGDNGVLNIFAGVAKGSKVLLDISGCYINGQRWIGSSGTSIAFMLDTLRKTQDGKLFPNHSVAAIGGLKYAYKGLEAVKSGGFPGKVVIFPQLPDMPLIALSDLHKLLPEIAARLKEGKFWSKEAEEELLESQLNL